MIVVSIVWIIVVPDVTQPDITCKYHSPKACDQRNPIANTILSGGAVDFGIWSTLEPNIAVICACIPSLRPLVTIVRNGVFQYPIIQKSLKSTVTSVMSSKSKSGVSQSNSSELDGRFSRLEEMDDLRPLGHEVEVGTAARADGGESGGGPDGMPVPDSGIGVKTDVIVETSGRLAYNDRLY